MWYNILGDFMNYNISELASFNTACDDFLAGKYILADIKISTILKTISADQKISNIVSSCLDSFEFETLFYSSIKNNDGEFFISLPNDNKQVIAFVYGLLYRLNNKTINFNDFISQYFATNENSSKEYDKFAYAIIMPFKQAINNIYSKRHVIVESDDYQNNYYNKIKIQLRLIMENINNYKLKINEKEEFTMLLNSLYIASDKNDKKLVFSLMIGLDYFTKCNKKCRVAYLSLEECFS